MAGRPGAAVAMAGVVIGVLSSLGNAATIDLDAQNRGWYDETGRHISGNLNYFAGRTFNVELDRFLDYHNFFVFDLPTVADPLVGATLVVESGEVPPMDGETRTYSTYSVSTSPTTLGSEEDSVAIFEDLGSGDLYGSHTFDSYISIEDTETWSITLSEEAVASISAALGGTWAVGGAVSDLETDDRWFYAFGGSQDIPLSDTQLHLTAIPEPATGFATLAAFTWLVMRRRGGRIGI